MKFSRNVLAAARIIQMLGFSVCGFCPTSLCKASSGGKRSQSERFDGADHLPKYLRNGASSRFPTSHVFFFARQKQMVLHECYFWWDYLGQERVQYLGLKLWSCGFSQLPSSQPKLVGFRNDWQYGETGDVTLKEGECIEGVSEWVAYHGWNWFCRYCWREEIQLTTWLFLKPCK